MHRQNATEREQPPSAGLRLCGFFGKPTGYHLLSMRRKGRAINPANPIPIRRAVLGSGTDVNTMGALWPARMMDCPGKGKISGEVLFQKVNDLPFARRKVAGPFGNALTEIKGHGPQLGTPGPGPMVAVSSELKG